jgi:hypothetical protein
LQQVNPTKKGEEQMKKIKVEVERSYISFLNFLSLKLAALKQNRIYQALRDDRGDVPGWVLVVLMTTGLVTAIWTIAAPRLTAILKNSLDAMNGIR